MLDTVAATFTHAVPALEYWSLRLVEQQRETLVVRQGILQPVDSQRERGAFVTVIDGAGVGYAATGDLSAGGLARAVGRARQWATDTAGLGLFDAGLLPRVEHQGRYQTALEIPWDALGLEDRIGMLQDACQALQTNARIVDAMAWVGWRRVEQLLVTAAGGRIEQRFDYLLPGLAAVANAGSQTQRRTAGTARQGGLEQLAQVGFPQEAPRVAEEALALLQAPECPEGEMDLILTPSQMALQIHESIGHPLELDRVLGDERNYAGTSFVTPDMFGRYRYGSALLNVTFDPGVAGELAGYAFDDEGTPATREFLIRNGVLERPLGGACSQARAALPGVASARASGWKRPPIDRMANLNLEPGESTLQDLVGGVENGVLMDSNRSWSIDDSRNKFQFGCELGRVIRDGELGPLVRNPGYRGISATFWRSLAGVGDQSTFQVHGVPNCGKGEPNQLIQVGHAAPPCLFRKVQVFGGTA